MRILPHPKKKKMINFFKNLSPIYVHLLYRNGTLNKTVFALSLAE